MRFLIIDDKAKIEIKRVVDYVTQHKVSKPTLIGMVAGIIPPIGDDPGYICYFEDGYRVAFSIEEQPCGWCRHISISVSPRNGKQLLPNVPATEMIMQEFGMKGNINECENVSIEEGDFVTIDGATQAINIIQKIE